MKIRSALLDDMSAICVLSNEINELHFQSMPETFAQPDGSDRDKPYWESYLQDDMAKLFVADIEGKIVGAMGVKLVLNRSIPFLVDKLRCHIGTVIVNEKYRRQGLGTELMAAAENYANENNVEEIILEVMNFNDEAMKFYRHLDYVNFSSKLLKSL